MKKFLVFLCVVGLFFGLVGMAQATPMIYNFSGTVNAVGTDPTGIITAQGLTVGSTVTYSVLIDLAAPGYSTLNNGTVIARPPDSATIDSFFADYISGSLLPGGGAYVGPTNYAEYNFGYQRADAANAGFLTLGNSDSLLSFYAPLDVSDWVVGTLVRVTNNVYAPNGSGGVATSIMVAHDVALQSVTSAAVPEPATLLLLGSGLAGLGIFGRRRRKLHNN